MGEGETVSSLQKTLQIICHNNGWSYGVFWRFHERNSMLLAMEDFYYEQQYGMLVHNILPQIHILGEGAVGQAALSGKHRWMFSDRGIGEDISAFPASQEDDAEFQSQFSVGIKTIAVIPVERIGVVQFGSTKKIFQRVEFLDETKTMLWNVKAINGATLETDAPPSSSSENWELDGFFASLLLPGNSDNDSSVLNNLAFETPSTTPSFDLFFSSQMGYENSVGTFNSLSSTIDLFSVEESLFEGFRNSMEEQFSMDSSSAMPVDDLIQWRSSAPEQPFHDNLSLFNGFSSMSSSLLERESEVFPMPSNVQENSKLDINSRVHSNAGLFSKLGLEKLLDGLKTSKSHTKSCLEGEFSANFKRRRLESSERIEPSSYTLEKANTRTGEGDDGYSFNVKSSIFDHSQKYEKSARLTRKRARPGESNRPRPKDRQQIQDRFKELRGIIPNGGKCSIDSLLDKTIKYMLFLQNVTEYAHNLKQANKPKDNEAATKENRATSSGATWALEVDGKTMVCPIKVEDLAGRGQMLIEMVCEEREHSLEIADMIRGFGLSILKGVVEVRENKTWGSFIVEAKKHITRVDVFWSLMHRLHPNNMGGHEFEIQPINRLDDKESTVSFPVSFAGRSKPVTGFLKPKAL